MEFLSNMLVVQYDAASNSILVKHPDGKEYPHALVQIRQGTYDEMSFEQCAEFLGARLLLLMPGMRLHYKDEIERLANSD